MAFNIDGDTKNGLNNLIEISVISSLGCLIGRVVSDVSKSLNFNLAVVGASSVLYLIIDRTAQKLIKFAIDEDKIPVNPPVSALRLAGSAAAASATVRFLAPRFGLPSTPIAPVIALILSAHAVYSLFYLGYVSSRMLQIEVVDK